MPRIELHVETNFTGIHDTDVIDCPDDWADMTEAERTEWADEALAEHVANFASSGWRLLDD
ncbi:DUF7167 family protein [Yinghuangia aomiensis]